jgi:CRP/FNR family transcriptional regulator, anaerobic regulatory protein
MTDADLYLNHYKQVCPEITDAELSIVQQAIVVKHYQPKEIVHYSGSTPSELLFLTKGLMRLFYENAQGDEVTVWFAQEHSYAVDYVAFVTQSPSSYCVQCIEACTAVSLSYVAVEHGYRAGKHIERYGRLITQQAFALQQQRVNSFVFKTTEQRYLDFVAQHGDLCNRVPQKFIASFLGMERQSLSRVRQAMSKKWGL